MLDRLTPNPGSHKRSRRKGRGQGSGIGKTCGRGHKGAGARSGSKRRTWHEGGQMPLARRLPKFGFTNLFRVPRQVVNVEDLAKLKADAVVDSTALAASGLIRHSGRPVKLLARGEISTAVSLRVDAVSEAARKKIEGAGGSIELIPAKINKLIRRKTKATPS